MIDRDPLKLIRYAEGEGQTWFTAKQTEIGLTTSPAIASQVLSFENICMVDGFWTSTSIFIGCRLVWKDCTEQTQLVGTRNQRRRESALHSNWKLYNGQWTACCIIRYVNILGQTVRI